MILLHTQYKINIRMLILTFECCNIHRFIQILVYGLVIIIMYKSLYGDRSIPVSTSIAITRPRPIMLKFSPAAGRAEVTFREGTAPFALP